MRTALVLLLGWAASGCAGATRDEPRSTGEGEPDAGPAASTAPVDPAEAVPVLVELFSSEGCSSCPPADRLLQKLDESQPAAGVQIVALELHVDYWNRLGWIDPFSSPAYSDRQTAYARVFGGSRYTPQMVIDGAVGFVGSNEARSLAALSEARARPHATIDVAVAGRAVSIDVRDTPAVSAGDTAEVWLAVSEAGLSSDVTRGENAGATLAHAPVARHLERVSALDRPNQHIDAALGDVAGSPSSQRVVVFVQERVSRRILGVGTAPRGG